MKYWKLVSAATALVLSSGVNASIVNTLNGVEYEWLELTETQGLSREQVESQIASSNEGDVLYGYQYASRSLFQSLLNSYASWDGIEGLHIQPSIVSGLTTFISDFGEGASHQYGSTFITTANDGSSVEYDGYSLTRGIFGDADECNYYGPEWRCYSTINLSTLNGVSVGAYQNDLSGWGDTFATVPTDYTNTEAGSYLVRQLSPVPVPAAVWLFGSGLIGLVGLARRKKA